MTGREASVGATNETQVTGPNGGSDPAGPTSAGGTTDAGGRAGAGGGAARAGGAPADAALALAARYLAAVEARDDEALRALYEPDALTWHNTDGQEQALEANLAVLNSLRRAVPDLAMTDVRVLATSDGFVQRHTIVGTAPGGPLALASCLVVQVSAAGRIARVEEYLDSAGLRPLRR